MGQEILNNIIPALITGIFAFAGQVLALKYDARKTRKELKLDPVRKDTKKKSRIIMKLSLLLSLIISAYDISIFVRDPVLDNVVWLCLGVSIFFFTVSNYYLILVFEKIIDLNKSDYEFHIGNLETTMELFGASLSATEKIAEFSTTTSKSFEHILKRLDKLESKKQV